MTDLSRVGGDYYKSLGSLEAMMSSHEKRLDAMDEKLDRILEMSARIKGGWATLSVVVSVAAAMGAISSKLYEILKQVFQG